MTTGDVRRSGKMAHGTSERVFAREPQGQYTSLNTSESGAGRAGFAGPLLPFPGGPTTGRKQAFTRHACRVPRRFGPVVLDIYGNLVDERAEEPRPMSRAQRDLRACAEVLPGSEVGGKK